MKAYKASLVFGFLFITVGIFGFIPNLIVSYQGFFVTNTAHNLVHILTGGIFLIGAIQFPRHASRIIKLIGLSYLTISLLGFFMPGEMMMGHIYINHADHSLHLGLAIIILATGFTLSDNRSRSAAIFMQVR